MTTIDPAPSLPELLDLEQIDRDLFRNRVVFEEPWALFGGQVAAQALLAAGRTVEPERAPHSLHGYYLRGGDAARPTVFQVFRDRDGGSFSARRVVALQDGEVIFNMAASFAADSAGADVSEDPAPEAPDPDALSGEPVHRAFSFEGRTVARQEGPGFPVQYWTRCVAPLPADRLVHAAALTYISDMYGAFPEVDEAESSPGPSLDHAVWFHRPIRADEWMLVDLVPRTAAGGRNWYIGTLHDRAGSLVASIAQENLFRRPRG
jgi:acyl-CoA thioesterase-2